MARRNSSTLGVSKRLFAILMALIMGGTGVAVGAKMVLKRTPPPLDPGFKVTGEAGDIGLITSWNMSPEEFVVMNVGNHQKVETHFQDYKIEKLNERDVPVGLIISSDAKNEAEVYDDVEYAKGLIEKHEVNYPVYLNIDKIMENDDLNPEMKREIIKCFLEKCTSNKIYVGLYGTDTNLCRVLEYCGITGYDAFLVMDQEEIQYTGSYSICQGLDGKVQSKSHLDDIINSKNLNETSGFVNDGSYIFKEGDDLTDIAMTYGMSVNELLRFNNISDKDDLQPGTKLRIPTIVDATIPTQVGEFKELDEPIRGADISYAQSELDWDQIEDNFEFMILRVSQGTHLDKTFESNAKNCNLHDIPMGVYCYNDFDNRDTTDLDEFKELQTEQADFVLDNLKNKKVEYPVYLDIEAPNGVDLKDLLSPEQVAEMLEIWCTKMQASGYIPGIYCNQSTFKYIQSCVDYPVAKELQVWIAGGDQYYGETKDIELEDVRPSSVLDNESYGATMGQSTDSAINSGAGNSKGHVDVNFSTIDYTDQETVYENDLYETKQFERTDGELLAGAIGAGAAVVLAGGAAIAIKGRKKNHGRGTKKSTSSSTGPRH